MDMILLSYLSMHVRVHFTFVHLLCVSIAFHVEDFCCLLFLVLSSLGRISGSGFVWCLVDLLAVTSTALCCMFQLSLSVFLGNTNKLWILLFFIRAFALTN